MSFHDLHDLNINKNEFNIDIWMEKIGGKKKPMYQVGISNKMN